MEREARMSKSYQVNVWSVTDNNSYVLFSPTPKDAAEAAARAHCAAGRGDWKGEDRTFKLLQATVDRFEDGVSQRYTVCCKRGQVWDCRASETLTPQ